MRPKTRKLLDFLATGAKLESQVVGSGLSNALNDALRAGWADIQASPTVKAGKVPAAECVITEKGREALRRAGEPIAKPER